MGSIYGNSIAHMTGAIGPTGRKTADLGRTTLEIRTVADLATGKSLVGSRLRFGYVTVLGRIDPPGRMQAGVAQGVVETARLSTRRLGRRCGQMGEEPA